MDDRELLHRLRQNDEQAFASVFRTWCAPLVRLATGMLYIEDVAEETPTDSEDSET